MKRTGLLNAPLCSAIAHLGHTDRLVIGDAGLPVPPGTSRIDLAVVPGVPGFLEVLDAVAGEMMIERVTIAREMGGNSAFYQTVLRRLASLGKAQGRQIAVTEITHEDFKRESAQARAVVRTGECTPYANIILHAGVCF
jgi:D-ribose pyranase